MHTIAANAYIAYRSVRGRLQDTALPHELDALCALIMRFLWVNGASCAAETIRIEFGLPRSTLSSAMRRLEKAGYIRRDQNVIDGRYVNVTLTPSGRRISPIVSELVGDLEDDIRGATRPGELRAFDEVTTMLAVLAAEAAEP
jgi:DNA-binding MarR family transcriptional regulator